MALHLLKLCVGASGVADMEDWVARRAELLAGGSLCWVVGGDVFLRQRIVDLRAVTRPGGIERCEIVLDRTLHRTQAQPRRAFQGGVI